MLVLTKIAMTGLFALVACHPRPIRIPFPEPKGLVSVQGEYTVDLDPKGDPLIDYATVVLKSPSQITKAQKEICTQHSTCTITFTGTIVVIERRWQP